jgi:hypothetical protein
MRKWCQESLLGAWQASALLPIPSLTARLPTDRYASGFALNFLAQVAVGQDNAPAVLLDLYLATWSYILAVAGVTLLSGWWLWQ